MHNLSFDWPRGDIEKPSIETAFEQSIRWMRDNVAMFAAKCAQFKNCRFLFYHPPVLAWTGKPPASSEEEALKLYRARHASYVGLIESPAYRPLWERYCDATRSTVEALGGTYIEASEEPAFGSDEDLFCDALYPNEAGAEILTKTIARWADTVS